MDINVKNLLQFISLNIYKLKKTIQIIQIENYQKDLRFFMSYEGRSKYNDLATVTYLMLVCI